MSGLEIAKLIVDMFLEEASCGMFDHRNWVGDPMETVYDDGELVICICREQEYFEVFGLPCRDFEKLRDHYRHRLEEIGS